MDKFCKKCGAPTRAEKTGYFDTATGKPKQRLICSSVPCHSGHDIEWQDKSFIGLFAVWKPDGICKRCKRGIWAD